MDTLGVIVLMLMLAITTSETKLVLPTLEYNVVETLNIFEKGDYKIVKKPCSLSPPKDLYIVSPEKEGRYPIFLFVHGTMMPTYFYSDIFEHIASHGFIVVAPQIYLEWIPLWIPPQQKEIEDTVSVANWLLSNLDNVLPKGVEGDLTKLTISGHSRGAKTAFALALGVHQTQLNVGISALVAIDPVAGLSKSDRTKPYLLTYKPNSFNLSIPVTVIGSGLGNRSIIPIFGPCCAPNGVNHVEFFNECQSATHFVIADYGHNDLLNDDIALDLPYGLLATGMCVNGRGSKGLMRRTLGGIVVGFLDYAYFLPGAHQFITILKDPSLAPARLYPVESKVKKRDYHKYDLRKFKL